MENYEYSDIEEIVTISSANAEFNIEIKDFRSATSPIHIYVTFEHTDRSFEYFFWTEIIPNHIENTERWLTFDPQSAVHIDLIRKLEYEYLCFTVSIIDVEGQSRFPRSYGYFGALISSGPFDENMKYLKKSFILEREEEFLPDGVLTLRFDFSFDSRYLDGLNRDVRPETQFLFSEHRIQNLYETVPLGDSYFKRLGTYLRVYDFTCRILSLPQFHDARRRFGVYGFPPKEPLVNLELEEILEHIWIVDSQDKDQMIPCRFLLSDEENSVLTKLLEASPVIRRIVNTLIEEIEEKRIVFQEGYKIFYHVLVFLNTGEVQTNGRNELVNLYKFSHRYEMEELQRKCARHLVENSELEVLEEIAELHQDEYLSELLTIRRNGYGNHKVSLFRPHDTPNFDCYM